MAVHPLAAVVPENLVRFLGHDTHEHEEPHLVYVVSGSAVFTADGESLTLRHGEAVWIAPFVPHAVRVAEGGMIFGPFLDAHVLPGQRIRPIGRVPAIVDVMTTLLGAAPTTDEQIAPFRDALGTILTGLGRQYFPVAMPRHTAALALAREAVRSPLLLEQLAQRHHLSPRQVQRIFLKETGFPFARWRSRARLNAAVTCLGSGGSLSDATQVAGYVTRAGLVRALSRETGIETAALADDPVRALAGATAGVS